MTERAKLDGRLLELDRALLPFAPVDIDRVDLALNAMLMGFRNQRRQTDDADIATIGVLRVVLRDYPAWAIEEAWLRIARHEAGLDPHWVPSDAEIAAVAKGVVVPYRARRDVIKTVLSAKIALTPAPPLTRAEVEAKLGRPVAKAAAVKPMPEHTGQTTEQEDPPPLPDGKHAQRVEAWLAERRLRREREANP